MNQQDLNAFLSDPSLVELIERVKISDDFLDVVTLSETQHSDMLAWCLHPNEGHCQGDAVIKDFLIAAYGAGAATNTYSNKNFFKAWTPGRIRTSSFGSAFIVREFSLKTEDISKKRRLDLFLIDLNNRIVVTIENKAGASLTEQQLSSYWDRVNTQISYRPVFNDFEFLYVVVDRNLDTYTEDQLSNLGNKWALLDYSWLHASAKRARLHMERNNEAAQLLMSYCQKQTGWQSPNEQYISELSAALASQHEAVVEQIRLIQKLNPTAWTPSSFSGPSGDLLQFVQQNRQLCDHLVQARGIGSVLVNLRQTLPSLDPTQIEHTRTWLNFATDDMESLMRSADGSWPIYINVWRDTKNDDETAKFTVRLIWRNEHFLDDGCDLDALRTHVAQKYPELSKFENRSVRRLVLGTKLEVSKAVKKAVDIANEINLLIRSASQNGILQ